ncbi:unnamed protein product, partial [Prorocentrum cordatum]
VPAPAEAPPGDKRAGPKPHAQPQSPPSQPAPRRAAPPLPRAAGGQADRPHSWPAGGRAPLRAGALGARAGRGAGGTAGAAGAEPELSSSSYERPSSDVDADAPLPAAAGASAPAATPPMVAAAGGARSAGGALAVPPAALHRPQRRSDGNGGPACRRRQRRSRPRPPWKGNGRRRRRAAPRCVAAVELDRGEHPIESEYGADWARAVQTPDSRSAWADLLEDAAGSEGSEGGHWAGRREGDGLEDDGIGRDEFLQALRFCLDSSAGWRRAGSRRRSM